MLGPNLFVSSFLEHPCHATKRSGARTDDDYASFTDLKTKMRLCRDAGGAGVKGDEGSSAAAGGGNRPFSDLLRLDKVGGPLILFDTSYYSIPFCT